MKLRIVAWLLSLGILVSNGACVAPPDGLISWWRGNGNALDSAGINDGVPVGGLRFAPGVVGFGFNFSGEGGDYVRLPQNMFPVPSWGEGNVPFTFETWFKTTRSGVILGQQDIPPFVDLGGYVPALYVGTNGFLYTTMFWGTAGDLVSPVPVNDGIFHHVAVVYDGNSQSLMLDGQVVGTTPQVQMGYADVYYYQLGTGFTGGWVATPGGWFPFAGIVDEPALYARALSAAEISAIYSAGTAGKCGGPVLRHRYSFNEPVGSRVVKDLMRRGDAALVYAATNAPYNNGIPDGSGFTGNGALELKGISGYVELPPGIISPLASMTIEAWLTWNGPSTSLWQRIFDFGSHDGVSNLGRQGTNYLMLCPSRGDQFVLGFQQTEVNPFKGQDPEGVVLYGNTALPIGQAAHVALVYDPPAAAAALYLNGAPVASISGRILNPLKDFTDHYNWLGRSQWAPDPQFNGSFDEFRIWEAALTASEIWEHYRGGPDQDFKGVIQPSLAIGWNPAGVVLSWSALNTEGYRLEASTSMTAGTWQPVSTQVSQNGSILYTTLPRGDRQMFYRLAK